MDSYQNADSAFVAPFILLSSSLLPVVAASRSRQPSLCWSICRLLSVLQSYHTKNQSQIALKQRMEGSSDPDLLHLYETFFRQDGELRTVA